LKEKKLVGFPSHGMVLCVSTPDKSQVKILEPPQNAKIGDIVTVDGLTNTDYEVGVKKLMDSWD